MSILLNNRTNVSFYYSHDVNEVISTELSIYLSVIVGLVALTGTSFNLYQLILICRSKLIRTYLNYMFYQMLFPCLSSSLIDIPNFLFGTYLSLFYSSSIYCSIFFVQSYATYGLFVYQLFWINIERHRYLFQLNQKISFQRQFFPFVLIVLFVYICSICFVLLPRCSKTFPCQICFLQNSSHTLLFSIYTFFFPLLTMIICISILFRRLFYHRIQLNKGRRLFRLKRMFYQSIIYLIWFTFSYLPFTIYSLLISFDQQRFQSAPLKSILFVLNICAIQFLPILTYFIFKTKNVESSSKSSFPFRQRKRIIERF